MSENATLLDQSTAISEEAERNFGISPTEQAPQEGHPSPEVKEERLYGGKYKSIEDFEKAHKEAEAKFHEISTERKRIEDTLHTTQQRLSEAEQARLQYEAMLSQRTGVVQNQEPSSYEKFKTTINDDPNVMGTMAEFVQETANQAFAPRLQRHDLEAIKTRNEIFSMRLEHKKEKDPVFTELLPEVSQTAAKELQALETKLLWQGMTPQQARGVIQDLNTDIEYTEQVYRRVLGSKGADFWASRINPAPKEDDAKKHLGGGGGSADGVDSDDSELQKLLNTPGASRDPKKDARIKELMRKHGAMTPGL